MIRTKHQFSRTSRRKVEIVKRLLRAGQLAARLQILRQDRRKLREVAEGIHVRQYDKVTEELRLALVQFLMLQMKAIVANLMRVRQMRLREKNCGAGAPGSQGFQPGNTCAGGEAQASEIAASSLGADVAKHVYELTANMSEKEMRDAIASVESTPEKLFDMSTPGTTMVDTADVVPSRARKGGIDRATRVLYLSAVGKSPIDPRSPISVKKGESGWSIEDGNSTFAALKSAGWKRVPVVDVDATKSLVAEKNCGAGAPGSPGFQTGNTCAGDGGSGSGLSSGDFSEFLTAPQPNKIENLSGKKPAKLMAEMMPGIDWTDDEAREAMLGLSGVPDGWDVTIDQSYPGVVTIYANHPEDGVSSMTRQIEIEDGRVVLYNKEFELHPDERGKGVGVLMLAREVAYAQKYDIGNIRCTAAGTGLLRPERLRRLPDMNGATETKRGPNEYTGVVVWPNLGFDAKLESDFRPYIKFGEFHTPDSVKSATNISDVLKTEEGRQWWDNHGVAQNVVFDPKPGSLSTRVLAKVLQKKGMGGAKTSASTKTFSQPFGMRSQKRMPPPGSQPNTTAEGLSRMVFDPREWDKKLIETLMVPYAGAYLTAASSEIEIAKLAAERKSVDISRSKMIADYDRWKAFCPTGIGNGISTKASTASHFLRQQKEIQLEEMVVVTPLGEFRFNISTEYPKWMKRRLREVLEETFAQDYWKQINDTTSADITDILQRGIRDGWSIEDMADEIADGLPGDSDYAKNRATAIARTESGNSLNSARSAAIDDLAEELAPYGLPLKKSWMSVLGSTTRETHADADGVPADIEGMWTIGGFRCRWPGDTMLPAYERIACQCSILSEYGLTDTEANELIEDYNTRVQEREQFYRSQGKSYADLKSCGAGKPGSQGFEENNTCAGGGGSGGGGAEDEPYHPVLNPEGRYSNEDDEEQKKLPIDLPKKTPPLYGVESDADAPAVLVEDKDGNKIAVVDRSDENGHEYLDEVEADAEAKGLAVDFETVEEMQKNAGLDEDSGALQAYVGDAYKAFTDEDGDVPSGIEDTIDTYGYNHGAIDRDYASILINERMSEAESEWETLLHKDEISDEWDSWDDDQKEAAKDEWLNTKRSEIETDIEDQRHWARQEAVRGMRQELESGTASSTLACCAQLYRGISISETRLQEMIEEGEVVHSGVNSWTTSRSTAKKFTGGGGNASRRQVILVARSPKAGFINKANGLDEKEVIRPPSSMKIKQVVKTKTMVFLYVDEDPDYAE